MPGSITRDRAGPTHTPLTKLPRRLTALLMVVLALISCGGPPPPIEYVAPPPGAPTEASMATVSINDGACAGVTVAPLLVVTAHHCVGDPGNVVNIGTVGGGFAVATVIRSIQTSDLALLVSSKELPWPSPVRNGMPHIHETVFTVGHPADLTWNYSRGYVVSRRVISSVVDNERGVSVGPALFSTAHMRIWFGNSGGGVFDEHGHLLGVVSQMDSEGTLTIFTYNPSLVAFLRGEDICDVDEIACPDEV